MNTNTRKILAVILLVLALFSHAFSQIPGMAINTDGATSHNSAMLDVSSTTSGFLPPRMTYSQKMAIVAPLAGLLIWCSNCGASGELQIYNGSAWTNFVGGAVSAGKPDAPTIGTAAVSGVSGTATVAFTAPASNGGAAITSYTATSSPGGLTAKLSQAGSGTITFNGLTNGTAYTFTVTATNAMGASVASSPSNSVSPFTVPGAPVIGTATAGNSQATVTFTAPASNGGSAITSYTATSTPGGFTGTISQAGSGAISVTGLTNGTAYTFTVKATNAAGTGAASVASNSITPTAPPITDGSGNTYESVTIGTQTWLKKNLITTKYNDGTVIPNLSSNSAWSAATSGAWCDYDNNWFNGTTYGKLYNGFAATSSKLCPIGWHVPSYTEWNTLFTFLGGETVAGGKLKEAGTTHWKDPNTFATNSSGFTALPSGLRSSNGVFLVLGSYGNLYTSYLSSTQVWYMQISYNTGDITKNAQVRQSGFAVRCLKD